MKFHPLADIFPLLEGEPFNELVASIKEHDLLEPIVLLDEMILDGRNRYRACLEAGVEPRFAAYSGGDPLAFVIAKNLTRRHLNESQRAMVAAKIANLAVGSNQYMARVTHDNAAGEKFDPPFESASANLRRPTASEAGKILNVDIIDKLFLLVRCSLCPR